jgi:hypothetical protein
MLPGRPCLVGLELLGAHQEAWKFRLRWFAHTLLTPLLCLRCHRIAPQIVSAMDAELERYHKSNAGLDLAIQAREHARTSAAGPRGPGPRGCAPLTSVG